MIFFSLNLLAFTDFFVAIKVLLENGADANIKDLFGKTALDIAYEKGKF